MVCFSKPVYPYSEGLVGHWYHPRSQKRIENVWKLSKIKSEDIMGKYKECCDMYGIPSDNLLYGIYDRSYLEYQMNLREETGLINGTCISENADVYLRHLKEKKIQPSLVLGEWITRKGTKGTHCFTMYWTKEPNFDWKSLDIFDWHDFNHPAGHPVPRKASVEQWKFIRYHLWVEDNANAWAQRAPYFAYMINFFNPNGNMEGGYFKTAVYQQVIDVPYNGKIHKVVVNEGVDYSKLDEEQVIKNLMSEKNTNMTVGKRITKKLMKKYRKEYNIPRWVSRHTIYYLGMLGYDFTNPNHLDLYYRDIEEQHHYRLYNQFHGNSVDAVSPCPFSKMACAETLCSKYNFNGFKFNGKKSEKTSDENMNIMKKKYAEAVINNLKQREYDSIGMINQLSRMFKINKYELKNMDVNEFMSTCEKYGVKYR